MKRIFVFAIIAAILTAAAAASRRDLKPAAKPLPKKASQTRKPAAAKPKPIKVTKTPNVELPPRAQVKHTAPESLVLLYTASATGQVRSCNCTKFRYGGYGRELTLLKSLRTELKDSVLIEGGDTCGWTGFQAELKADITAKSLKLLDYDAMVPGEEELGVRGARYIGFFDPKAVPIVCANLVKDDQLVYPPYVVLKTKGGARVGLIGLVDLNVGNPFVAKSFTEKIKEPAQVLPALIKELRGKADVIVVVYHAPADKAEQLAKIPGVDVVISSHRSDKNKLFPPQGSNEIEAPVRVENGVAIVDAKTRTNWCLGRLDLQLGPDGKVKSAKHRLVFLDRSFVEDPEMVKIYDDYNAKVKQAVLTNSAKLKKDAEAMLIKRGLNPDEMRKRLHRSPFATSEKCKDCHKSIYDNWSQSKHATAMADLEKVNQDYDPECVSCHVTGALVRNGFANRKEDPELVNVQCEACHGPGLQHATVPLKGYGKTGEQTCRSCHTDERTPDFDFDTAWAKLNHTSPTASNTASAP